jgi:hypothetical protein
MRTLFDAAGLQVTEEWVRAAGARIPVTRIQDVWVARPPRATRRWPALVALVVFVLAGVAWFIWRDWFSTHWATLVVGGVAIGALFIWGIGLDLLTYHIEHRDHDLWISDGKRRLRIWRHNEVEVNKALRAINRARDLLN